MSTVVNGHRDEDSTHTHGHTHQGHTHQGHIHQGRTHHGHILPMLSFSASTPTDEENPLDTNPAIAIDTPLWEQPEDVIGSSMVTEPPLQGSQTTQYDFHHQHHHDTQTTAATTVTTTPYIDVNRAVVLVDGVKEDEEDDEPDERAPLLGTGGGSGGGTGSGGIGGGNRGLGLTLPLNMPRRSSSYTGLVMENGEADPNMASSIASFLRSKSESENLFSCDASCSPQDSEKLLDGEVKSPADPVLLNVANQFVKDILTKAQEEATKKDLATDKVVIDADKIRSDERLMEVVRRFVSDIMIKAKAEAWDSMRQIQNNNNNIVNVKDEAAAATGGGGGGGAGTVGGAAGLASPGSIQGERVYRRRGPWYVQMGRVFATFLSRICPCRCPTKP
ncbi:uncharacterized protein LOC121871824 isoform X2 [Homarus americanus]|uniref:uncharacterized protein LOC121871824 isoform X2 n=1 Tax=Homarus americanus TaxID=6706 RepID=UPI001C495FCA|nr:uncharacterized protein LOC121871824 isoform X2 [Homarus americanus]